MPEHPIFSPKDRLMQTDEVISIASAFVKMGVRKIRLTGGEPLIRTDAPEILEGLGMLQAHGLQELTLTSNGIFIHNYVDNLRMSGVRTLNISLDTLLPERFVSLTKRDHFHRVMSNIHLLLQEGFRIKVNVVVMKGVNDDELIHFIAWTRDYPIHVRFIEFMPFQGNSWQDKRLIRTAELLERARAFYEFNPLENKPNDTSRAFQVLGFSGTFAFISTMSSPFCGDCNRLRLTADGKIKNCLFSKGEIDLLAAFRKGQFIEEAVHQALVTKEQQWGGQELFEAIENRSMVAIGG